MSEMLAQLARIRERQGLAPIDGTKIEGFGPGLPPPPPLPDDFPAEPPEFPMNDPEPEPSPLVDLGRTPPVAPEPARVPQDGLFVAGTSGQPCFASYRGRDVVLAEKEIAAITRVVLQALARTVRTQLSEVEALLPKRKRRKAGGEHALAEGPSPVSRPRRGRPKKSEPKN